MSVESKPIFSPELLRKAAHDFTLPAAVEAARPRLQHWADLIISGKADTFKETALLPEFLTDIFSQLLGYTGPAGPGDSFTMLRETHVEVDGQFADAALGRFTASAQRFVVAVEGKGTRDPLERPFAGRRMSAVDQAYRYAINLPCDWIIVTSMRETRLYHKGSNQQTYERFETVRLASDEALLRRFVFLLGAERVAPESGPCHLDTLLLSSESAGRELTNQFYTLYAGIRRQVFNQLRQANSAADPNEILRCTQKLLDRVIFCSFCEDRGLLPPDTVRGAFEHSDPYNPRPVWENFRGLFRFVDAGNATLKIPAYNGGLFAHDPGLDTLTVPDAVCALFRDLAEYDYRPARESGEADDSVEIRPVIDVDILGHIFEQSITDLELLRLDLASGDAAPDETQAKTRRKKEGAFYTPAFITRYIVEQTLGSVIRARFETLRASEEAAATGTAKKALADPSAYDLATLNEPQRKALIRFWEQWQEQLKALRIVDPACGSGAFLIEAFDQLHAHYEVSNARLEELRGHRTLFDLDRQILQHNLCGVDLNAEAVQICQLSLWIKTAAHGKQLTSLDHSIREGNSIISDPATHPKAFDWHAAFPEIMARGGFDVVVGNPPYVRQELLTPFKPWLEQRYTSYHGMADLYVYFYELGMTLLRPGGLMSYIVTNKWMKAGYGEPLRRFFRDQAWVRSVVDFGHAKQIFEEADVFPCILVAEKPTNEEKPNTARLCTIPREQLRIDDLSVQIEKEGQEMDVAALSADEWQLESGRVMELLSKIRNAGVPLSKFLGRKPITGIKTGLNEVYLISTELKEALIKSDGRSAELIKPFFRGSDVGRWNSEKSPVWMLLLKSSADHEWPWSGAAKDDAEKIFASTYPAIYEHVNGYRDGLMKRQDQGRYWWELRPCAYYALFDKPKIFFQLIQFHPCYAFDELGTYGNNKTGFISADDLYLLAVLNSPLMWWHNWRHLPHMKDEALAPNPTVLETIPIAEPTAAIREAAETAVRRLIEITASQQQTQRTVLDWLRVEYAIEKPGRKLAALTVLDSDAFVAEVKKLRGKKQPLTAASLAALRDEHTRSIAPARQQATEALALERSLSDLVNQAYGLTPDEMNLMWATAPPRMPFAGP